MCHSRVCYVTSGLFLIANALCARCELCKVRSIPVSTRTSPQWRTRAIFLFWLHVKNMCRPVSKTHFNWLSAWLLAQLWHSLHWVSGSTCCATRNLPGSLMASGEIRRTDGRPTTDDVPRMDRRSMVGRRTDDPNLRSREGYQLIVT